MSNICSAIISFKHSKQLIAEEEGKAWHLMWRFVGLLYKDGNVLNISEFFSSIETDFIVYSVIPDKNSFDDKNIGVHALSAKKELQAMGVITSYDITAKHVSENKELTIERSIENAQFLIIYPPNSVDDCESQLVLRTNEGKYLPTYVLNNDKDPYLSEQLTFWKKNYTAVDTLGLSSYDYLEPIMVKQLANLDSDISIKGIELAKRIENILEKKVFYPLAEPIRDGKYIRSNSLQCPSCLEDWSLQKTFLRIFDFKCNHCFLLGYVLPD